jgi:phosphatidylglycerophosphate synthase
MPPDPLWNLPNAISMSRVLLAALFIGARWEQRLWLIALASLSDFLDGWLARRRHITSRWGALIDPLTDRIFVFVAICVYLFEGQIATWQYAAFLLRDLMTAVGFLVAKAMPSLRMVDFRARWSGKVVTVLQLLVLFAIPARYLAVKLSIRSDPGSTWYVGSQQLGDWLFVAVAIAALWSVVDYTLDLRRARGHVRTA